MEIRYYDLVGFVGIVMIVGAYLLLQTGRLRSDDLNYSLFNGIGALCILYSIAFAFSLSAFLIEVFWCVISLIGIARYLRRRHADREAQKKSGHL